MHEILKASLKNPGTIITSFQHQNGSTVAKKNIIQLKKLRNSFIFGDRQFRCSGFIEWLSVSAWIQREVCPFGPRMTFCLYQKAINPICNKFKLGPSYHKYDEKEQYLKHKYAASSNSSILELRRPKPFLAYNLVLIIPYQTLI